MKQNKLPDGVTWEEIERLIKKNPYYKEQIEKLSTKKLQFLLEEANHAKLLEYAREGIEETEPEKLTDEYVMIVAEGMKELVLHPLNKDP